MMTVKWEGMIVNIESTYLQGKIKKLLLNKNIRKEPRLVKRFSLEEDSLLKSMHSDGSSVKEIADTLGRNPVSINSRMNTLGINKTSERILNL